MAGTCRMRRRDFLKAAGAAGLFVTFPAFPQEPEKVPDRLAGIPPTSTRI